MLRYVFFIFMFISVGLFSQSLSPLSVEIVDKNSDVSLAYPELGNLVAPQFSETDLDGDGIMDLFVFDRNGNVPLPFLRKQNGDYSFAPDLIASFPESMHSWALIRDYNQDGIGDIFTTPTIPGIPGIEVWEGSRTEDGLHYEKIKIDINGFDALQYQSGSNWVIIYVAFTDVPGIEDMDGDGDLDIVTFDPGGSLASYFRNYSVEEGFELDTFIMDVADFCWGKFREDEFSSLLSLSDNPGACASSARSSAVLRHSGSTLSFPDVDRDGVYDLLLGDLSSSSITLLSNGGSPTEAWMTSIHHDFPAYDVPIGGAFFMSTFMVDIDGDGKKDILASPNTRLTHPTRENVWLYYDRGQDTAHYELVKKNFLIDESLLLGGDTHPCLLDVDMDGDMDLIVGSSGLPEENGDVKSTLYYFENISTAGGIKYKLREDNYLDIKSIDTESGRFAPAAGDLDGDGDVDLVIGDSDGKLVYYKNIAEPDQPPLFDEGVYNYFEIDVGQNAKPQIIDMDEDGLADLVVGERNDNRQGDLLGGLNYFKNIGSVGEPLFDPSADAAGNTSVLGGIFTRDQGQPVGSSSPAFVKGVDDFFGLIGSQSGKLKLYSNIAENLYSQSDLVSEDLLPYRLGSNSTPVVGDINGNELMDVVVGSSRGSLTFFETTIRTDGTTSINENLGPQTVIYPNPSNGHFVLKSKQAIHRVLVYDLTGKLIVDTKEKQFFIPNPGFYLADIIGTAGRETLKLMVSK